MAMSIDVVLHPLVPLAFGTAFLLVTLLRSILSARQLGRSPLVIDRRDPILGFVGAVFAVIVFALLIYFVAIAAAPALERAMGQVPRVHEDGWRLASLVVLTASLIWMAAAQFAMGRSWRVGIDQTEILELRTNGPFAVSRNPIFTGMLGLAAGLALWSPTAVTLAALAAAYISLEVQIRAEEVYLDRTIGEAYRRYRARTPRWI
jgi:protein-S-isoprenylcysteine O-methyltransferase Ste14